MNASSNSSNSGRTAHNAAVADFHPPVSSAKNNVPLDDWPAHHVANSAASAREYSSLSADSAEKMIAAARNNKDQGSNSLSRLAAAEYSNHERLAAVLSKFHQEQQQHSVAP